MAGVDDVVAVTVKAKWIPTEAPTRESLMAEAAALGDSFSDMTSTRGISLIPRSCCAASRCGAAHMAWAE